MISTRPAIPFLVHEDCMDSIKFGLAEQQENLSEIKDNTDSAKRSLNGINGTVSLMEQSQRRIETGIVDLRSSSSNTATATSSLNSSVGTTADTATSNTVIGLLKSISNKLSL